MTMRRCVIVAVVVREERGYGAEHRRLRAEWAPRVAAGGVRCARPGCGELIRPDEAWDLGHTDDRTGWVGAEHAACNRAGRPRDRPLPRSAGGYQAPLCPF